jgi:O-antigen/teichoic acid export membrane protein
MLAGRNAVAPAQVTAQAAMFARNVVLARALGPAEMGTAAAVALAMTLAEMASDVVAEEILIAGEKADDPALQSTVQGLRLLRGAILGVVLAVLSLPVAWFVGVPDAWAAVAASALIPLVRGLAHCDVDRQMRSGRYHAYVAVHVVPHVLAFVTAWPLAWLFGDYRAVIATVILHAFACTATTQLLAARPYRIRIDRASAMQVMRFGLPVLVNGVLLFFVFQADRFVVSHLFDTATLGLYVTVTGLALVPSLIVARVNAAVALPVLTRARTDIAAFQAAWTSCGSLMCIVAGVSGASFVLLGPSLLGVIYGPKFDGGAPLIGWTGVAASIFVMRDAYGVAAMARGDTRFPLVGNAIRAAAIGLVSALAFFGSDIVTIVAVLGATEWLALAASARLVSRRHRLPLAQEMPCIGVGAGLLMSNFVQPAIHIAGMAIVLSCIGVAIRRRLLAHPAPEPMLLEVAS